VQAYNVWSCYIWNVSLCCTGVYGMWNIYVFCLLIFYAPSTKYMPVADAGKDATLYS